jgi:tetratricopeptide (TPR) repeat protein
MPSANDATITQAIHPARLLSAMMVLTGLLLLAWIGAHQSGMLQALVLAAVGFSIFLAPFSAILGALALVSRHNGLAELFSQYYLLFRELTKFILPNDFGFTGIAVTNLAVLAVSEGRFIDAKELLTEKCTLRIDQALKFSLLGQICAFTGDTEQALQKLAEARQLVVDASGDQPDTTHMQALAEFYSNECGLLPDIGKAEQAIESGLKGLQLRENFCGPESYEVAKTLNNVGYAQIKAGRFEDACVTLQRAYDIAKKLSKESDYAGGNIINNLGCALYETGQRERAFEMLNTACSLPADGPFERGYREYTLAHALAGNSKHLDAARHCAKAFRYWRNVQGLNHPDYRECILLYAECLKKIGKQNELEKVRDAVRKLERGEHVPPKAMPLIR